MAETDKSKLQLKMILTALETDVSSIADDIGAQRPVVSDIVNGGNRKALTVRRDVATEICKKVTSLILLPDQIEAEKAA